jgi:hypothetical protein
MAVDKSLSQHYDNKYSAKNRRRYFTGAYGGEDAGRGRDDSPSHDHGPDRDPGPAHLSHNAPAPAPAPVDYSSLDNEEQQAVDRGEPTAQMTPTERNEQGHGPGGTDNPDYKRKQYEEDQKAEANRSNQLAEARRLMTQPIDVQMPGARTPISLGKIDPYQQSHILPNEILTDPWSTYDLQKKKKEIDAARKIDVGFQEALKKGATDFAKSQAKKMVRNKVMKELGLAGINPLLTLGSFLLGKFAPNKKAALQSKIAAATKNLTKPRETSPYLTSGAAGGARLKKPTVHKESDNLAQVVSGQTDVISKAVNQFKGTKVDDYLSNMVKNDLNRALHFYARMTPMIEAGKASQKEMDAYELLGFYLNKQNQAMQGGSTYI